MAKRFLVNAPRKTMASVKVGGRHASRSEWGASRFRRNKPKRAKSRKRATPAQLAARKKFAAMARARAAAARRGSGASSTGGSMKTRRKSRKAVRRNPGRKRSRGAARRRYAGARHHAKRGRRRMHRNPGIVGVITGTVVDTGVVLVAGGAGRMLSNLIPFNASTPANQPYVDFGKAAVIAVAVRSFGAKFLGQDRARLAAIGVLLGPTKNLITSFAPSVSPYLGAGGPMFLPRSISQRNPAISGYPATGNRGSYTAPQQHFAAYPSSAREVGY